jgi:hypothetical protein
MSDRVKKLQDVVGEAARKSREGPATIADIIAVFQDRLLGPFLIVAGTIGVSPIGGIPGVPSVIGLTIALFSLQFLFGESSPWIPGIIAEREIDGDKFSRFEEGARPWLKRIDRFIHPRLIWATGAIGSRIATLAVIVLALLMIPLEALPFAAAIPASGAVFFGLALTARDGLLLMIGAAITLGVIALAGWMVWGV